MPFFQKHFTVEEANALLPELRRIHAEVDTEIRRLQENDGELAKAMEAVITNGGGKKIDEFLRSSDLVRDRLRQIDEMGVQVKDIRRGLLDFPAFRQDEEVLLCWLVEEPQVEYWHDLENGFMSRRRIE